MNHILKITIVFLFWVLYSGCQSPDKADLLFFNGVIWTGEVENSLAEWVSIKGNLVDRVGTGEGQRPQAVNSIDLKGQFMIPGFNDSHVHFASAGSLLLGINLLDVNEDDLFVQRVKETTERLPVGSWITGGDWGAYEAWSMGSEGKESQRSHFVPHRSLIDSITQDYPLLVNKYDQSVYMANRAALDYLGMESVDGILNEDQAQLALGKIPEKSFERKVAEAERALQECREKGVTTVQDMSPFDRLEVYEHIRSQGNLTCRINFSPSRLSEYNNMIEKGWVINWTNPDNPEPAGDEWIAFGTLKTHIDGIMGGRTARFYKPYSDNTSGEHDWRGGWREFSKDMPSFKQMILEADKAGIQLRVHAIGDEANAILLDILDTMEIVNGARDRRFRIVHAQVVAGQDFQRFQGKNVVAEVQPYHVTDDMRWMEERIGYERCKGAYAFKRLEENDCILSFGSDWPGTNASYYPIDPLYGIYAAVTRQTINGEPAKGWFPDQRVSLEQALRAYTWGSAYGAFEEKIKGTITPGKLADMTVLDMNLFETEPEEWLEAEVMYTIVGGEIVFDY